MLRRLIQLFYSYIVLNTNNTVAALDILIPKMMEQGFEFVTVSEIIDK